MRFPISRFSARALAPVAVLACSLLLTSTASAVTFGQLDNFQSGTTAGWDHGSRSDNPPTDIPTGGPAGAGDRFLRNVSQGSGAGSRQVMFNQAQWTGNYSAAGVT